MADLEEAGIEDLFRKIRGDLDLHAVQLSDHQIRAKMDEVLGRSAGLGASRDLSAQRSTPRLVIAQAYQMKNTHNAGDDAVHDHAPLAPLTSCAVGEP